MPTVYADNTDGVVYSDQNSAQSTAGWAACRNATDGNVVYNDIIYTTAGVHTKKWSNAGSGQFTIRRTFYAFDTSGIGTELGDPGGDDCAIAATLKIYGRTYGTADVIAVKATAPDLSTAIATSDFDALYGWKADFTPNDLIAYSSEISTWSTSGYNDITLNIKAIRDMSSLDVFKVAILEYDYDYLGVEYDPGTTGEVSAGMYFNHVSSLADGKRPYIDYTVGACGFGHKVNGVSPTVIASIINVGASNASTVVGKSTLQF